MLVQTLKTACPSSWYCSGSIWNIVHKRGWSYLRIAVCNIRINL